jgi:hypothetical protein
MNLPEAEPRHVLVAAAAAIVALMAMSEFQPMEVACIEAVGEDITELTVVVQHCRGCTGGFLLNISDGLGGEALAFCPSKLLPTSIPAGTAAHIALQRSSEDPEFFIVSSLTAIDRK